MLRLHAQQIKLTILIGIIVSILLFLDELKREVLIS
jgi:hypothetical protein